MGIRLAFVVLLAISILLESILPIIPSTLLVLLVLLVIKQDSSVFLLAFIAGLLLDMLSVRTVGASSLFFTAFLFLLLLYNRKYEIVSVPFIVIASAIGSLFFLLIFGYSNIVLQVILSGVFALLLFLPMRLFVTNQAV